jgi:TolB-like protein
LQDVIIEFTEIALLSARKRALPPLSQQIHSHAEPGAEAGVPCSAEVSGSRCIARGAECRLYCHHGAFHCRVRGAAVMGHSAVRIPHRILLNFCSARDDGGRPTIPRRARLTAETTWQIKALLGDAPAYSLGRVPLLTRSDFESAVKDALRHYTQADLLTGNALLHASVLTRSESGAATPQALRALLADTAKGLFAGERDQRLYRVLELTYLNPAPKQEAAAERLGLSFSTYRRHLTAGVDRLIEWLWDQDQQAVVSASDPAQATSPSTRPRLSIVILPFLNLSGDASVDYIVDAIVDSLITDLSTHVLGSFVISRSTAFAYKGRSVGIRQIGSELGVRYVLEGSVSADASRIGVNVQLIDAETDEHLWAERFDKERRDIRQVQEEIVGRLSRSVGLEMVRAEVARRGPDTNSSDAEDLTMRGRTLVHDVKQRQNAEEAIDLFRQALELDPDYVDAMAGIALARTYQVINLYRLEERDALLDEAELMVSRGMALSPTISRY